MPHQISIESNELGVVILFSGVVSGAEILALNLRLLSEEVFAQCRYQIWDFSEATGLDITTEQLHSVVMQDVAASETHPNLRAAIVGRPSFFGGSDRILQAYEAAWTTYKLKLFLDVETAREWALSDHL